MTLSSACAHGIYLRLFWQLLFVQMVILVGFLYFSLISLGGYLLLLGFDAEHAQPQRLMALAGGALILLASLWLLKLAMPRRISPAGG
ncbi:hypothetical protein C6A77_06040 [Pseudomonas sp. AFG_SD02_1510_Pfu_092]|nr:hypothetical protein C6A77_06040 [Pseudomonas sp. AFG_SD02_1510_Pfu_092]